MSTGDGIAIAAIVVSIAIGMPAIRWARAEVYAFWDQNALMRADLQSRGVEVPTMYADSAKLPWRLYVPMIATGIFMFVTVAIAGYDIYDRHRGVSPTPAVEEWNRSADVHGGPIGPHLAVELASLFAGLPKPCDIKVTSWDRERTEFEKTLRWLVTYGRPEIDGAPICQLESSDLPPPDANDPTPVQQNGNKGIVIHWNTDYPAGKIVARQLDTDGFLVSTSNQLPKHSPQNLIWIDIGPGSPWK